jgi:hypothetical protein
LVKSGFEVRSATHSSALQALFLEKTKMKNLITICAMIGLLLGFASNSNALPIPFSDNFDSENGGNYKLNYNGFANWTVVDGTVDLIGEGSSWNFFPGEGYGLYIDLDGSTHNPGQMLSSSTFDLQPGTYTLSFDLAGNQRQAPDDQVTVQLALGSLLKTYTLHNNAPFTTFTETIIVSSATTASLSFEGTGSDNIGMLLDNVTLVPEPATICLLGLGGLLLRKRRT